MMVMQFIYFGQCEAGLNELDEYLDTGKDYCNNEYFRLQTKKGKITFQSLNNKRRSRRNSLKKLQFDI